MASQTVLGFNSHSILASAQQQVLQDFLHIQEEGENQGGSSSVNKLIGTVIPLLIVSIPIVFTFFYLRNKQHRVYAPRTFLDTLKDEEKTPKPAFGMFNWLSAFLKLPDDFVLNHQSLDNYLFIRYFRMVSQICLIGTLLTWPTLVVVNSRGGGGQSALDSATLSNVTDTTQLYWHTIVAWIFFIYVMYIITRETIYYINLRQAYLTTPRMAARLSTRVVLFTGVPEDYRNETWIKADHKGVKRVWIATDCTDLDAMLKTMNDTAMNLEQAELKMSTVATKKFIKGEKHFASDLERAGTVTGQWVSQDERPSTRINPPVIGRKVDAIELYRDQLQALVAQVEYSQRQHAIGNAKLLPALFVEFESQRAAQAAYSMPFWKQPEGIQPACISIAKPDEVVWENLRIGKAERWIRTIIANTVITLLILFWSIPVGIAGSLGDLDNIANNVPPLAFLKDLPPSVTGVVSGLLPTILISALLAIVPAICRYAARKSGSPTLAEIELKTQGAYFAFQVIQVFLITTFSSGAATVAKQIFQDPTKAPTLLADNLPKASVFYLSFFVLQGLTVTATTIFQIAPFLIFNILSPYLDKTPRAKYERWTTLSALTWGDTYPKFTTFAVIAISYSCIAPLVLGFAAMGLYFLYFAFRYNIFYVLTMQVDTKGDAYGRAMQHLSVGIYLAELCLIGLFGARGANPQAALMVLLFVLTAIYQTYLNLMLSPLENTLSDELMAEDEEEALAHAGAQGGEQPIDAQGSDSVTPRAPLAPNPNASVADRALAHSRHGGLFASFLFNGSRSNYPQIRRMLWESFPGQPAPKLDDKTIETAFLHPSIKAKMPKLWVAKDALGVSKEEIALTKKKGIDITDDGASFDEKGNLVWDQDNLRQAPIFEDRVEY